MQEQSTHANACEVRDAEATAAEGPPSPAAAGLKERTASRRLPPEPDPYLPRGRHLHDLDQFGEMFTMTRRYRDSGGVPLSVTLKMKCAVFGLSTSGALIVWT